MREKVTLKRLLGVLTVLVVGPGQFVLAEPTREKAHTEEIIRKQAREDFHYQRDKADELQAKLNTKIAELHSSQLDCHPH